MLSAEVVPVVLDLRTVGDREAGITEDLLDATTHASDRMQTTDRLPSARQRHIDRIARKLRGELRALQAPRDALRAPSSTFASLR